jgi:hypothetical protein
VVHIVLGPEIVGTDELVLKAVLVPGGLEDFDGLWNYLLCDTVPYQG